MNLRSCDDSVYYYQNYGAGDADEDALPAEGGVGWPVENFWGN